AQQQDAQTALNDLQGLARGSEIPSLDNAAKALAGVTALLTGLFTGLGFATGDFVRMYRDFAPQGLAFLILSSVALLLGTFAFVINGYRSNLNLWAERIAIYLGIGCAAFAFVLAAWGLSQGASNGPTRPSISASFDQSNPPLLTVNFVVSGVSRSQHLAG